VEFLENDSSEYSSGTEVDLDSKAQDAPDEAGEDFTEGATAESRIENDFEYVCHFRPCTCF
jgi:hypothetical protein